METWSVEPTENIIPSSCCVKVQRNYDRWKWIAIGGFFSARALSYRKELRPGHCLFYRPFCEVPEKLLLIMFLFSFSFNFRFIQNKVQCVRKHLTSCSIWLLQRMLLLFCSSSIVFMASCSLYVYLRDLPASLVYFLNIWLNLIKLYMQIWSPSL
jgi:hypothetical protein